MVMRTIRWAALAVPLFLGACGSSGVGLLVPLGEEAEGGKIVTILAATTRAPASEEFKGHMFSGDRAAPGQVNYALLTLSLPPGRKHGELPINAEKPDPSKHITLVSARVMDAGAAFSYLRSEAARRPAAQRRALVFTHGYNTKFDEAAVRFAQIVDDVGYKGVPVLFSWPSRGETTGYGYDKESANYSRDAFEHTLTAVAKEKTITGIDIFAHSMGNWLTMETLRSVAISNNKGLTDKIGAVVLAAPDVDMDVFRTQTARLGGLQHKFVLYASSDDYALRISSKLAGGKLRAGETTDVDSFKSLGVEAHNLSDVAGGVGRNHGKAFGDGATITGIGGVLAARSAGREHQGAGDLVSHGFDAVGNAVSGVGKVLTGNVR